MLPRAVRALANGVRPFSQRCREGLWKRSCVGSNVGKCRMTSQGFHCITKLPSRRLSSAERRWVQDREDLRSQAIVLLSSARNRQEKVALEKQHGVGPSWHAVGVYEWRLDFRRDCIRREVWGEVVAVKA